jgi:hypothetical protein
VRLQPRVAGVDVAPPARSPAPWAAGNATDPPAEVITGRGTRSAAAIAINTELVQEDADAAGGRVPPLSAAGARRLAGLQSA